MRPILSSSLAALALALTASPCRAFVVLPSDSSTAVTATPTLYSTVDGREPSSAAATRSDFLSSAALASLAVAGTAAALTAPLPASARGRATLEQSYDRYVERITSGGQFYSTALKSSITKGDFEAIKAATSEPPPKSKEDRIKADGGVAERAAKAGGFSDARVLAAADLFASSFSDNSISTKTKAMKAEVEIMREVVDGMNSAAKQALGEEKASGGLLPFGMGAKQPTKAECAQKIRELYVKGGNAYNKYVYEANEALPIQLKKLPYI